MDAILIIDDDPIILNLLRTLLELEGYEVFAATEKDQIDPILEGSPPDLVLIDVHLWAREGSNDSGYDILEAIRRTPGLENTRIVMTSGIDLQDQAIRAGADGFLLKPYIPDELMSTIRSMIE